MKRVFSVFLCLLSLTGFSQVITDTTTLRTTINTQIVPNGQRQISANQLNRILNGVLNTLTPYGLDSLSYDSTTNQLKYYRYAGFPTTTIQLKRVYSGGGSGTVTSVGAGLWLLGGPVTTSGTLLVDSALMAAYFVRRKDSTINFVTPTQLATKIGLTNLSATSPIFYNNTTGVFSSQAGSASQNGYITTTDFQNFAGKQNAITWQNVTVGSSKITLSGTPTGSVFNPFSIDVNEANLTLSNMGGTLGIGHGGTGSAVGAVDTIYRTAGKDSIQFTIGGRYHSILDSVGSISGGSDSGVVAGFGVSINRIAANNRVVSTDTGNSANGLPTFFPRKRDSTVGGYYPYSSNPRTFANTPYPLPKPYGTLYSQNSWTVLGAPYTGTPRGNLTAVLSGNFINISSGTGSFTSSMDFLPYNGTMLNNKTFTVIFKNIAATSTATNFGVGFHHIGNNNLGALFYVATNTGSGSGNIAAATETGTALPGATSTGTPINVNDVVSMSVTVNDSSISLSLTNITTGVTVTAGPYNYLIQGSPPQLPGACNFSVWSFANSVNTVQIQSVTMSSTSNKNPNGIMVGDSKLQAYYANNWFSRTVRQLGRQYNNIESYSGGGEQASELATYLWEEYKNINPHRVIYELGSNDLRFGASLSTVEATMNKIFTLDLQAGRTPYFIIIPEDSTAGTLPGIGMKAFDLWARSTSCLATYIPRVWDSMSTNNILKPVYKYSGDGIHLNQAGNDKLDSLLVNSNVFVSQDLTSKSIFRTTDNQVMFSGDSLYLRYPLNPLATYFPFWSTDSVLSPSLMSQSGTTVTTTGTNSTVGLIQSVGSSSNGLFLGERGSSTSSGKGFINYTSSGGLYNIFDFYHSRNTATLDTGYHFTIYNQRGDGGFIGGDALISLPANGTTEASLIPIRMRPSTTLVNAAGSIGGLQYDGHYLWFTGGLPSAAAHKLAFYDSLPSSGNGIGKDSVITITAGTSSTVTDDYNIVRFNPSTVMSTYTLTLPTNWHTSNDLLISFGGTITSGNPVVNTLTIVNGSGQTLLQAITPTTANAGEIIRYHLIGTIDQRTN